jgi:4-hydroxythreonine-4-phosphate dehydrogenase
VDEKAPLLAVSLGCPGGIGAEVSLRAALDARRDGAPYQVVALGDVTLLRARAAAVGAADADVVEVRTLAEARALTHGLPVLQVGAPLGEASLRPGAPTREAGAAQLAGIDAACDAVARGEADALVTAPVSKHAIVESGAPGSVGFLGHTEYLGARLGGYETIMAFVADALTITLATTHLSIADVPGRLRAHDVARAAFWTARLVDALHAPAHTAGEPHAHHALAVAVLALNPHAGEGGLIGLEEQTTIAPGIADARARLAAIGSTRTLVGPLPAESAIRRCVHERAFAACVAMYHDQATIPSKLVAFGDAVNVTLGLPIVRTSVDHGTAYDLAGKGVADARGMRSALDLGAKLARSRALLQPLAP